MNKREQCGKEIAQKSDQIKRIDENWYQVKAQSLKTDSWYDVISTEKGFVCDCPDHQWRKVKCKHIFAVEISLRLRKAVKQNIVISPINVQTCINCQSAKIKKDGIRHNKTQDLQRYRCLSCSKKFSINLGFEKMHASPKIITSAMQLYFTGESLRNVQKFLKLQGVDFTHISIYKWVKKYTKLMDEYLKTIQPQVGDKWRADEVWLKISGDRKYLFAMMDEDTRFWIAQEVAATKFKHDARSLLKLGKEATGKTPQTFITDGLPAYNEAFKKEFWVLKGRRPEHIRHISIKGDKNNNMMERLNGEFRDREKVFRGLKKDDSPAITGIKLYHNYIRPHMSLDNQTPADRAGIKVEGDNKWITLIQNASQHPKVNTKNKHPIN